MLKKKKNWIPSHSVTMFLGHFVNIFTYENRYHLNSYSSAEFACVHNSVQLSQKEVCQSDQIFTLYFPFE